MNTVFGNVRPTSHGWTRFVGSLPVASTLLFALGFGIRYKFLLGDAPDSPVVDVRGSNKQFLAGLGLLYSW